MTFTGKPFYMIAICVSISKTAEMLLNKKQLKNPAFLAKIATFFRERKRFTRYLRSPWFDFNLDGGIRKLMSAAF